MAAGGRRKRKQQNKQQIVRAQPIRELIGRSVYGGVQASVYRNRAQPLTVDSTIPDYAFWDRLRRGKASGYTLGGLFCSRIEHIFATWVLGGGVDVTLRDPETQPPPHEGLPNVSPASMVTIDGSAALDGYPTTWGPLLGPPNEWEQNPVGQPISTSPASTLVAPPPPVPLGTDTEYTNTAIADFILSLLDAGQDNQDEDSARDVQSSQLLSIYEDALGLGDQYVIVNTDGTLSIPSPDTVAVRHNPLDYRIVDSYLITTKLPGYYITDEYRVDGRTITIKQGDAHPVVQEYQNLIGRIPVVHIANEQSGNEVYGHPIHEDLLPLFNEYDDVIYKQLDGVKMMGNPTPVLKGLEDVNKTKRDNSPGTADTYTDKDGNEATRDQFKLDRNAALFLGVGADFMYASPPVGFTKDTQQALDTLFLLLQYRTGIPKFAWGDELASSRSTAGVQADQFVKDIEGRQRDNGGWIVRLVKIWLAFRALTDPQIVLGNLQLHWPTLQQENKDTQLKQIDFAKTNNLLSDEAALTLLDLVDDPAEEVKLAQDEATKRMNALYPDGVPAPGTPGAPTTPKPPGKPGLPVKQMDDGEQLEAPELTTSYYIIDAVRELRQALLEVD